MNESKPTLEPIEPPPLIDASRCRLREDIRRAKENPWINHVVMTIPEAELVLSILDAAKRCQSEWVPTARDKQRGCGTGVGMRAAEDQLIRLLQTV